MRRRRLLVITRNLPPLTGGMERLLARAIGELAQRFDVCVIGPAGSRSLLPASVRVHTTPGSGLLGYLVSSMPLALWCAWRFRPDGVLAGSGVTAPVARVAAAICGVPYAVFAHGLDVIARSAIYQRWFVPCLRAADLVVANSKNTRRLCAEAGVPQARLAVLPPGVEYPPAAVTIRFRASFGIGGRPLLLSVGRIVPRKGLARFIERTLPAIVSACPDVCLAIVGEEGAQALAGAGSETAAIERAIGTTGLANAVVRCGRVADELLTAAYQEADLFVFPVLDLPGDVEGFGMVAIEAAAAGLATVGFRAGGLEDAVIDGSTGRLAPPERYDTLASMIIDELRSGRELHRAACREHAARHSWGPYGAALTAHLERMLEGVAADLQAER
ncbi:MAG: glycosyltransferase family 4 protein [Gammaproteobacteria bacterium]